MKQERWYFVLLLFSLSWIAHAEVGVDDAIENHQAQPAKLDLGIGIGYSQIPHYIGSAQNHHYTVPYPYVYYRSEHLTVDRRAVTASLWEDNNWSLDWSLSAAFALDSDENQARQNMPDLAWVAQVGPAIKYRFELDNASKQSLTAVFAVRQAVSLDGFSLDHAGFLFEPGLIYQQSFNWLAHQWRISTQAQLVFADAKYLDYYYGVAEQFVTAKRSAYSSHTGFQSARLSLGLTVKHNNWWFGGFARYYDLSGSDIVDSPLVTSKQNLLVGVAITRIFSIY